MSIELTPEQLAAAEGIASRNGAAPRPPKFNARQLADELTAEAPVAIGGGQLHVFRNGHYQAGGKTILRSRIVQKLGDDWRRNRADETIGYLTDSVPALLEVPPLDHVNCSNGIVDLLDGELQPHTPDYLSPIQIPVRYDPAATCPRIDRFLLDTVGRELADLVYEIAGYLVVADNSLQVAFMLLGSGANGKSTLLGVLTDLIGAANVSNVALHRLDEDRFAAAELFGKLANVFADLDSRALQASSVFKAITGGDSITGERKYADPFSFRPYARLLFSANEPPPTPDNSDAFFRRWVVIPFERRFEGNAADRNLTYKLTSGAELSGLLNRGLERLPDLRSRGAFTSTSAGDQAARRFRVDSDSVAGFLEDRCEADDPAARTRQSDMFPAYRQWCDEANRGKLGKQKFNRRLAELVPALSEVKSGGFRYWEGIRLNSEANR